MNEDPEHRVHTDVAAAALGVLDPPGQAAFTAHLDGCARCRRELRELSVIEPLLAEHARLEALPHPGRPGRRHPATRFAAAACLAAALAVGGWTAVETLRPGDGAGPAATPDQHRASERLVGTDPETGVSGAVVVEETAWGTRLGLELSGVEGPLRCRLVAVATDGTEQVAMSWSVPDSGYGVGGPAPLDVTGAVALSRRDLERVQVRTFGGRTLVSLRA